MGLGTVRKNQVVRLDSKFFRLDTLLPNGQWCLTELNSGLVDQKTEDELWSCYSRGQLVFVKGQEGAARDEPPAIFHALSAAASLGPAPPVQADAAGEVGVLCKRYVDSIKRMSKPVAIEAISGLWRELKWPKNPPGYSTVMRWRKKANGHPDPIRALRSKHCNKGRRGHRYNADVLTIMREVRDVHYRNMNPRISIRKATSIVADKIRVENATRPKSQHLRFPQRKAMAAVIREIDARELLAERYGPDKALAMFRVSLGGVKTTRPLERVEIDHTVLSIILLDDDFEPIGRAFFTAAKDAHTRSVVGVYWGAEVPSVVSLARCLKHSIQPKAEFLRDYPNVVNDWPCFGSAESWVIDNGMEEHSGGLLQAASESGVQKVEYCARLSPWEKPNIERYMWTQEQDLIHGLPGAVMENIEKRSDFNPKKDMLMRWSSFGRLLIKWIVDIYMQQPLASLGNCSPYQMWNKSKGLFTQFVPDTTTILENLFLRQLKDRSLDHEGVEFDCLIYNSMDMKVVREKFGRKLKVNIRVNDADLSYIYVQVPSHNIWVRVPCLDQEYTAGPLTRWQHERCKRMRKACIDEGLELSLAQAREQIRNDVAEEQKAVKQGRKKARARMFEKEKTKQSTGFDRRGSLPKPQNKSQSAKKRASKKKPTAKKAAGLAVEYFER